MLEQNMMVFETLTPRKFPLMVSQQHTVSECYATIEICLSLKNNRGNSSMFNVLYSTLLLPLDNIVTRALTP